MRYCNTRILSLVALAASTATFVPAASAQAAEPSFYRVQVILDQYKPYDINDCAVGSDCNTAEIYGAFSASNNGSGSAFDSEGRNLAIWGQTAWCDNNDVVESWTSSSNPHCNRRIVSGASYDFADAMLCPATSYATCASPAAKNRNAITLTVRAGQKIRIGAHVMDADDGSSDDTICQTHEWTSAFTHSQLKTLDYVDDMGSWSNGDGACLVSYRIRTLSYS